MYIYVYIYMYVYICIYTYIYIYMYVCMYLQDLFWAQLYRLLYFPGSSAGVESTCNARDPGLIPGSGRSAGKGIGYPLQYSWVSLVVQLVKSACNVGDLGSVPGLRRSPGERNSSYPLQYFGLENSMDCTIHGVTKHRT